MSYYIAKLKELLKLLQKLRTKTDYLSIKAVNDDLDKCIEIVRKIKKV